MSNKANAWLAGVAGLGAVVTVAGVGTARSIGRRKFDDPYRHENFDLLETDRGSIVMTDDGVPLAVREVGPANAPLTVVFVHGFCLQMESFHFQRRELASRWGDKVRMVFYDQRGHGRSGLPTPESCTIRQLGDDLETVLRVLVPRGNVVLVGHSMGGMTILAHAGRYPEQYGRKIVGVGLIASAAEGLSQTAIGEGLRNPALRVLRTAVHYAPGPAHHGRGAVKSLVGPVLQAASYGGQRVSPTLVKFSERMIHQTPVTTIVDFLRALEQHDETAALPTIAPLPNLVVCGDSDMLTPHTESESMAAQLGTSELCELILVRESGHLVQLEHPGIVNDGIDRLVMHSTPTLFAAIKQRLRDRTGL
ncbi:MAG: alpha/beta fold hydrolase [Mycobacterium sp.]